MRLLEKDNSISLVARASLLSRKQVAEVCRELHQFYPDIVFKLGFISTRGDCDLSTPLRLLDKTDFFTKEIDALLLAGACRVAVHSAKDLPSPLPQGLTLVALTLGMTPLDSLVLRDGHSLADLPTMPQVGTSCARRENAVRQLLPGAICTDIRGTIDRRLTLLDGGAYDAIVVAEAALIRLELTGRTRLPLAGETAPLQGRLAVIARSEDKEMGTLFSAIDARHK